MTQANVLKEEIRKLERDRYKYTKDWDIFWIYHGEKLLENVTLIFCILTLCRSRESANLEYLKNIVLRFMMSTSYSVKQQMITAIATILEFSPKEVKLSYSLSFITI